MESVLRSLLQEISTPTGPTPPLRVTRMDRVMCTYSVTVRSKVSFSAVVSSIARAFDQAQFGGLELGQQVFDPRGVAFPGHFGERGVAVVAQFAVVVRGEAQRDDGGGGKPHERVDAVGIDDGGVAPGFKRLAGGAAEAEILHDDLRAGEGREDGVDRRVAVVGLPDEDAARTEEPVVLREVGDDRDVRRGAVEGQVDVGVERHVAVAFHRKAVRPDGEVGELREAVLGIDLLLRGQFHHFDRVDGGVDLRLLVEVEADRPGGLGLFAGADAVLLAVGARDEKQERGAAEEQGRKTGRALHLFPPSPRRRAGRRPSSGRSARRRVRRDARCICTAPRRRSPSRPGRCCRNRT